MCRRGEIYNVDFGNNENSYKQCGVRPALVVSNNRANENSPVVTVVPLTARVWKKKISSNPRTDTIKSKCWIIKTKHGIS